MDFRITLEPIAWFLVCGVLCIHWGKSLVLLTPFSLDISFATSDYLTGISHDVSDDLLLHHDDDDDDDVHT